MPISGIRHWLQGFHVTGIKGAMNCKGCFHMAGGAGAHLGVHHRRQSRRHHASQSVLNYVGSDRPQGDDLQERLHSAN